MRKNILFVGLLLSFLLVSCSNNTEGISNKENTTDLTYSNIKENSTSSEELNKDEVSDYAQEESKIEIVEVENTGEGIDLRGYSSTMLMAELSNMYSTPANYMGKTIVMEGTYTEYFDETTGKTYSSVIIWDDTACCSYGLEFILETQDPPEEGKSITVAGIFTTYEENGFTYCVLSKALLL